MSLTKEEAIALFENAQAKQNQGDYKGALKDFTVFLSYAQELGDKRGEGLAYSNIGLAHNSLGNYQDALKYHHKDLEIALQLGDKRGEGMAYGNIGLAHYRLGNIVVLLLNTTVLLLATAVD